MINFPRTMKAAQLRFFPLVLMLFVVALIQGAFAAPYGPQGKAIKWQQPTGEKFELRVFGDEFYACTETLDGYSVVCNAAAKTYYYAGLSADGASLVATTMAVGNGNPQALGLPKHLRITPAAAKEQALARVKKWEEGMQTGARWQARKAQHRAIRQAALQGAPSAAPPAYTSVGTKTGLCLLIDFPDDEKSVSQESIDGFCNGDNYNGDGNNGSVKQYFLDNSNNLLTYTNVVTAYIRMVKTKGYYNDISKDCGSQGNLLIRDALDILKKLPDYTSKILPTFSGLTVDGSKNVVACNVFYAGDNGGEWMYGLWPHSWALYEAGPQALGNGMKVNNYQITNIGDSLELGTFCHENGHMLCDFPDIYDYDYDSTGGAGIFCLMNSGGDGTNPVNICAYLKYASGWSTVTELTNTSAVAATLTATPNTAGFNHFFRYGNPKAPTEYFLLENRLRDGRDANITASGVAVWHVDEEGDRDNQSLAANSNHANYEVTLVQADNLWHFEKDPYNGGGGNDGDARDLYYQGNLAAGYSNTLTDVTTPNAHWWDGSASGLNVNSFSGPKAVMDLQFGRVLPPNTIIVDRPNGGEIFKHGSIQTVYWSSNTEGNVKIELYKADALHIVLSAEEGNDGNYTWAVSSDLPDGTDYKVKISTLTHPIYVEDSSDAVFTIKATPPEITSAKMVTGAIGREFSYQIVATNKPFEYGASGLPNGLVIDPLTGIIFGTPQAAGIFDATMTATNTIGTGRATLRLLIDSTNITLTEALDAASLTWTEGGASGWQPELTDTHDGEDAAQSRVLSHGQESWMETTVTGPGTISFWWKVSSEVYDKLHFTVDGAEHLGADGVPPISGGVNWRQQTENIDDGSHTLRWTYIKDGSGTIGADAGWVDQVKFTAVVRVPDIVVEQPQRTGLTDGVSTVNFGTVISGSNTSRVFALRNSGNGTLNSLAITFDGANAADFSVTQAPPTSIIPGEIGNFTIQLTPSGPGQRTAKLHFASNDPDENPFDINLTGLVAANQEYQSAGNLSIPAAGQASPYPSTIAVAGVSGKVVAVRLKLNTVLHQDASDLDMYLASPSGKVCAFMSDATATRMVTPGVNLVFDDAASTVIPGGSGFGSGTYRPWNYGTNDSLPPNSSGLTSVTTLNALGDGDPNGEWKLYVYDDLKYSSGSIASWTLIIETGKPEIAVEQPPGTNLTDGSASIDFGAVPFGSSSSEFTFTVKNAVSATDALSGLAVTKDGAAAADFTVSSLAASTLAAGASTTFTVRFAPTALGSRSAALHIASNDADENPFDITLTGTSGGTLLETWRQDNFGSPANSGDGADLNDFEKDGLVNLIEYAFGLDPKLGSAGKLPVPQAIENQMVLRFTQPAGVSGVSYGAEWSQELLPGTWLPVPDTGTAPEHVFSVPMDAKQKLYMRLKVTNP
jgi:M6 family metalloprotease-like protein